MLRLKTAICLFLAICCMGMGGASENIVAKIPRPDRNFTVTITDQTDTSYTVSQFSVDGLTFLPARLGDADLGIDFASLKAVHFYLQDDIILAKVDYNSIAKQEVKIDPQIIFYGQSKWGKLKLTAKYIKSIDFSKSKNSQ